MTLSKVLAVAISLRDDGATPAFCNGTDTSPISVGACQIYVVKFTDGTTWAVRIPRHTNSHLPPDSISTIVEVEMRTLAELSQAGFHWSPRLIGGDASFNNPIGHPYLVVNWVHGSVLKWTDTTPHQQREKILRQLVDIQLELLNRTKKSQDGFSALKYLQDIVDGRIQRVIDGQLPELDTRSCFVHRALLRHAVSNDLDASLSVIVHGNLAPHKIIIDEELNIKGIIDWELARRRPIQMGMGFPRLLSVEPANTDLNAPRVDNTVQVADALRPSSKLLADRQFVISHLLSLVHQEAFLGVTKEPSIVATMLRVLSEADVDWRDRIIDSCFSKGLCRWMAARSWLTNETRDISRVPSDEDLDKETQEFLNATARSAGMTREALLESLLPKKG
ncbi:hypothetical protein TruAng_007189 [Truncatella angustata]|nr:hypothetical protein TruAng_007189 [Truncatella angustata]